jgi:RNA polymerase sigma-70 factor (ECF subfamily)
MSIDDEDVPRIGRDPDLFEAFYREHVETVQRFVARRVSDPHVAADLTADVFLACIDAAHGYRPERGRPIAWLLGIGRNMMAAEVRRQARHLDVVRRVSGRRLLDADAVAAVEDRIDSERRTRRLYAALASLPRRDRVLMELVAVDGLSVADAARALGVKPSTARVRLHRCRARLGSQLRDSDLSGVAHIQEVSS